jgi:hypothetical protein
VEAFALLTATAGSVTKVVLEIIPRFGLVENIDLNNILYLLLQRYKGTSGEFGY